MYSFFFHCYCDPRDLHSFPTRRSSDLADRPDTPYSAARDGFFNPFNGIAGANNPNVVGAIGSGRVWSRIRSRVAARSEEHTSELQSLAYLVCRLLLEKKKHILRHSVIR